MQIEKLKKIFFLGIGGIGMSALARYFNTLGLAVSGYDRSPTALTRQLEAEGMVVCYDEDLGHLPLDLDLVIYTPAIPAQQAQLRHLRAEGRVPLHKRAEVLGWISRQRRCLAVAGTHGKTTTSSLLTHLLRAAGLDCTAFLGGISVDLGSNFVQGQSDWVVVEADEFDRSFLHLWPERAILTSTDADHLDIYGEAAELGRTYAQFARQVSDVVYVRAGLDLGSEPLAQRRDYAAGEAAAYSAQNIRVEAPYIYFDFHGPNHVLKDLCFTMPGLHNVENATGALALALDLGLDEEALRAGLASFRGIQRRFEWVHRSARGVFIDDYAHHPTELRAAIRAAKALYPDRQVLGVFQPHLYSRTRDFAAEFAQALDELDEVILLPIYPAREEPIAGVDSEMLFSAMKNPNKQLIEKEDLLDCLKNRKIEVLITLGAGDIGAMVGGLSRTLFEDSEKAGGLS